MGERIELEKTAIISSPSHSVRAMLYKGETVFAARDILTACGMRYPEKWAGRNAERYKIEKLSCPIMTRGGHRSVQMFFADSKSARKMIAATTCPEETRKWLQTEVLTFRIGDVAQDDEPGDPNPNSSRMDDIGKLVDRVLIELLEIKRFIAEGAAG